MGESISLTSVLPACPPAAEPGGGVKRDPLEPDERDDRGRRGQFTRFQHKQFSTA